MGKHLAHRRHVRRGLTFDRYHRFEEKRTHVVLFTLKDRAGDVTIELAQPLQTLDAPLFVNVAFLILVEFRVAPDAIHQIDAIDQIQNCPLEVSLSALEVVADSLGGLLHGIPLANDSWLKPVAFLHLCTDNIL